MLISNSNEKTALARFVDYNSPLKKIIPSNSVWSTTARNKEQQFALELLMDPGVPVVSLVGKQDQVKHY